jgi:hypothetical protein
MHDPADTLGDRPARAALLLGAVLVALAPSVPAQCVSLGPPGLVGCAPPGAPAPFLTCAGNLPTVGSSSFALAASGFPAGSSTVELFLGFCDPTPSAPPSFAIPCPPAPAGCLLQVDLGGFFVIPPRICGATSCIPVWPLPIPNDSSLVGATVCAQSIAIALAASPVCSAISNALSITLLP